MGFLKYSLVAVALFVTILHEPAHAKDIEIKLSLPPGQKSSALPSDWIAGEEWQIVDDGIENDDSDSPAITYRNEDPDAPLGVALLDKTVDGDFRFEARIKMTGDLSAYSGFLFFAQSPDELLRLYLADSGKFWIWSKHKGNVELALGDGSLQILDGKWCWIRVDVQGSHLRASASADGETFDEFLSYKFPDGPPPSGMLGLAGARHVSFDGIKISKPTDQ